MNVKPFILQTFAVIGVVLLTSCSHLVNHEKEREKARIYLQHAAEQLGQREYNLAVESTLEAIKYDPQYAAAYSHLALIYMETKRYQKSEEAFKKALELQPHYPEVLNNLGVLMNRQEKFKEAVDYFQKALEDDHYSTPENALTNMGYAHFRLGDLQQAKNSHQKAMDLAPQFCLAAKNMGDVYAKERNYMKASEYFQKGLTHCPLYQEAQYKLGLALVKLGQRSVARNHLEKLVERHKEGPYVERSNEVLKYLR